jgi:hypothetical protein
VSDVDAEKGQCISDLFPPAKGEKTNVRPIEKKVENEPARRGCRLAAVEKAEKERRAAHRLPVRLVFSQERNADRGAIGSADTGETATAKDKGHSQTPEPQAAANSNANETGSSDGKRKRRQTL